MRTTVIVVTLNRPDYVRKCLDCLIAQEPRPDQIIVVDASPDTETREVAEKYSGVLYLRNENGIGRMTASRNIGLKAASGDIIAFVDDDAFAHPGWLANLLATYTDPSIGAVGGRVLGSQSGEEASIEDIGRVKPNGLLAGHFSIDSQKEIFVDHIMGCNMSFRRSVIIQLGGFREDYPGISGVCEDTDMSLRVTRLGCKIVFQPKSCVDHVAAPQATGKRFDIGYTFFIHRNHTVMLIRNFGFFSRLVWRFIGYCAFKAAAASIKRIGSAIISAVYAFCGMFIGLVAGISLLILKGRDPVRKDEDSVNLRLSMENGRNQNSGASHAVRITEEA